MNWSDADIASAAKLWTEGHSATVIGKRFKATRNAILGLAHRNRALFPERTKRSLTTVTAQVQRSVPRPAGQQRLKSVNVPALRKARAASVEARPSVPMVPPVTPESPRWAEGSETGTRSDLSRFRLADVEPRPFLSLGRDQCRFPLVAFEAASGPDMPCCGAATDLLKSYCAAHRDVMAGRV